MNYWTIFTNSISGTISWIWNMITFQVAWNENWFYGLILISLVVWLLEILFPWRKKQNIIRKDFWLDAFYMFFNFFIFTIVIEAIYKVIGGFLGYHGVFMDSIALFNKDILPPALFILLFFILNDFVQWFTHVLLHRFNVLWQFHKVHQTLLS